MDIADKPIHLDVCDVDVEAVTDCISTSGKQSFRCPQGRKSAKEERQQYADESKLNEQRVEIEQMNAASVRMWAEAHKDSNMYNVMAHLGNNHPDAPRWFEMMVKTAVKEMVDKQEVEARK